MTYEDVKCPKCKAVGLNVIDEDVWTEQCWLVCECGHAIKELVAK